MLQRYGESARDEVNGRIDAMAAADDPAGYATWLNISLCLIALTVRPDLLPTN
ncbi:hypothetical protein [Sandarakinorhabdus sp. DWP1-3-1]|uniref:hypothetical protein n=1 Tax=Sandarakinorhabdus sp. DWP1-3-1 TaxID=2804627 RepID=UPI003CF6FF70